LANRRPTSPIATSTTLVITPSAAASPNSKFWNASM
jgi:hypothetical protein